DLDSNQALAAVWKRLRLACARSAGAILCLAPYLSRSQAELAFKMGIKHKVPLVGMVPSLLAAALAGHAEQCWSGSVLVVDVDESAVSIGIVRAVGNQATLLETRHYPGLGLKVWKDRLINALSDSCVVQTRRDPREVPLAEQGLFEQLDALLEAGLQGRMIQL